ncbi:hypothetical protein [Acidobacterium sp. S8]|uniref:hypothetical protein n=1 Tax=Acidobacterium sp. S8 TaxID=1641854 RepID=UPI00131B3C2F|nr:hypothetical protein [Acidobacterium sp. S8]
MNIRRNLPLTFSLLVASVLPAAAGVVISSPSSGNQVQSPFTLSAIAANCSSQNVSAMGYSLDNSSSTTIIYNSSMNAQISSGTGSHTVHVKAWGAKGAVCVTDVAVNVTGAADGPAIPSNATSVGSIQTLGNWKAVFDSGTGSGSATGYTGLTGSPSKSGQARVFSTTFKNYGGELYSASFGDDVNATNFIYDGWVYLTSSTSTMANLEMDMNQVMPNGQTVIFGFQCDGYSGTWDYTMNKGSAQKPVDSWVNTKASCNLKNWSKNAWHHIQVSYSRTDSGYVTYKSVWLDGVQQQINATVYSAFALGWAPTILTNFQVDGLGSGGTPVVYLDDLTIYRW